MGLGGRVTGMLARRATGVGCVAGLVAALVPALVARWVRLGGWFWAGWGCLWLAGRLGGSGFADWVVGRLGARLGWLGGSADGRLGSLTAGYLAGLVAGWGAGRGAQQGGAAGWDTRRLGGRVAPRFDWGRGIEVLARPVGPALAFAAVLSRCCSVRVSDVCGWLACCALPMQRDWLLDLTRTTEIDHRALTLVSHQTANKCR